MKLLLEALLSFNHWDEVCPAIAEMVDDLNQVSAPFTPTPMDLLDLLLCPRDEAGHFRHPCSRGECTQSCGWSGYFGDRLSVEDKKNKKGKHHIVKFQAYAPRGTHSMHKSGAEEEDGDFIDALKATRSVLQNQHARPSEFLDLFKDTLSDYQHHFTIAVHQAAMQKQLDELFADQTQGVRADMDFSENYTIMHQIEAQHEHWGHEQVTLFIVITHHHKRTGNTEQPFKVVPTTTLRAFAPATGVAKMPSFVSWT
jgi:hypothetical protein